MNKKYPKGSEWRKWDLHVHTPSSIYHRYGADTEETWGKYIEDLENLSSDFSVLGINDYFFIDGYERLVKEKAINDKLKNIDLLLPVVEFRIEKFAGIDFGQLKRINLHVIFSNELPIETIKSQFLQTLEQSYFLENGEQWTRAITKESVQELGAKIKTTVPPEQLHKYGTDLTEGFNNLNVKEEKIFEALQKDCFKGKYLIAIGKTEWGDLKWTDASIATKKSIINKADIVFTASESIEAFHKAKSQLTAQQVNDILLDCSDSHYLSTETDKDRIGNCFTWIKADPTFEGLVQILYEPNERIKISNSNPNLEFDKPYISNITINDDVNVFQDEEDLSFSKNESIPLNQNLVAIIGGRGEGKSMLTDYLASSFIGQEHSKEGDFNKNGVVNLSYHKSNQSEEDIINFDLTDDKKAVDFIYINQGRLKNLVEKKDKQFQLANSIRRLAKLKQPEFNTELDKKIRESINEYHELERFFEHKDEDNNLINSIEYLEIQEKSIKDFISNITTSENKDKLEKYSENLRLRNNLNSKLKELLELENELKNAIEELNLKIIKTNGDLKRISLIELNSLQKQFDEINNWKGELEKEIASISVTISVVKEEFKDYKGDLTTLLNDIDKFQKSLSEIRENIAVSKTRKERLESLKISIFETTDDSISLIDKMKLDYDNQVLELIKSWDEFKDVDSKDTLNPSQKSIMKNLLTDLEIEVKVDFDVSKFYDEIYHCIDGAKWRIKGNKEAQKNSFKIRDLDSFFEFLRKRYLEFYQNDGIHSKTFKNKLFDELERKKYLKVFPILKYKGKDLNKISVGQKGTVYLKMMLATEAFSKPIIFDQPEDDLDNEFIMQNLIGLFKELKQYRQVIIVTHNANLVVNADAEQVIVASNLDGKLNYSSGSLEDNEINSKICQILEGGEIAFEKRRNKYQKIG
ncbi:TrlF family AAA-like ATPase [Maribacter sp. Asnod2-G09]|uniref:TrlF family AAA-like ATPase n=1 Tax=Maribacter sp. Asnod2-G09 TaxID=3160577 RepID=UPI0038670331